MVTERQACLLLILGAIKIKSVLSAYRTNPTLGAPCVVLI